jgi:hypothetical protein
MGMQKEHQIYSGKKKKKKKKEKKKVKKGPGRDGMNSLC